MPAAAIVAGSVLSAGAGIYASSKASKAASKASDANAAIQQQQYAQTRADLAPYAGAGTAATSALSQRLGLSGTTTGSNVYSTSTTPTTTSTGTPNYAAYVQSNPDLLALFNAQKGMAKGKTMAEFGQYHYTNYGSGEGRQVPGVTTTSTDQAQTVPTSAATASTIPGQTFTDIGARPTTTRQPFAEAQPTSGAVPTFTAPTAPDLSGEGFKASPFYNVGLADTLRNVNASYGAKGLLKSGAGLQGATDAASNNFMSNYGQWANQQLGLYQTNLNQYNADRSSGLGQYNTDRAVNLGQYNTNRNVYDSEYNTDADRTNSIYDADRSYNTNQYDKYTGNLFNLASIGQNAAAGQANAGQNYANAATANNNNLASVKGNAAISTANSINNAISTGISAYGASKNPYAYDTMAGLY